MFEDQSKMISSTFLLYLLLVSRSSTSPVALEDLKAKTKEREMTYPVTNTIITPHNSKCDSRNPIRRITMSWCRLITSVGWGSRVSSYLELKRSGSLGDFDAGEVRTCSHGDWSLS